MKPDEEAARIEGAMMDRCREPYPRVCRRQPNQFAHLPRHARLDPRTLMWTMCGVLRQSQWVTGLWTAVTCPVCLSPEELG